MEKTNINSISNFFPMYELLTQNMEHVHSMYDGSNYITGLSTGFNQLDKVTLGLQASDLIVIASRPSMGKTTFALNIATHIAINNQLPIIIFSMSENAKQLSMRMLSSIAQIEYDKLLTGTLNDVDWDKLGQGITKLADSPIYIYGKYIMTLSEIYSACQNISEQTGKLGLIIIDYIQRILEPNENINQTIILEKTSYALKKIARELNVPVIAVSQLSRVEHRTDKRPVMSDLRGSGAIEECADLILSLYRESYYNPHTENPNLTELIINKNRNGKTGRIFLNFSNSYYCFENL